MTSNLYKDKIETYIKNFITNIYDKMNINYEDMSIYDFYKYQDYFLGNNLLKCFL